MTDLVAPAHVAHLAAVVLPEALLVALPLSVIQTILALSEGGELAAVRSSGVRPFSITFRLVTPLPPDMLPSRFSWVSTPLTKTFTRSRRPARALPPCKVRVPAVSVVPPE